MRKPFHALLLCSVVWTISACPGGPPDNPDFDAAGTTLCVASRDCPAGLFCVDFICLPAEDGGTADDATQADGAIDGGVVQDSGAVDAAGVDGAVVDGGSSLPCSASVRNGRCTSGAEVCVNGVCRLPLEEGSVACADGVDNDGDGYVDCYDLDCSETDLVNAVCVHGEQGGMCSDQQDNDLDRFVDSSDLDCFGPEDDNASCSDGYDNDDNGFEDCADYSCLRNPAVSVCACPAAGACENGGQCVGGFCVASPCTAQNPDGYCAVATEACVGGSCEDASGPEQTDQSCSDHADNDGDGYRDCADFSCSQSTEVSICPCGAGGDCSTAGHHNGGECVDGYCVVHECSSTYPTGRCANPLEICDAESFSCRPRTCEEGNPAGSCPTAGDVCAGGGCVTPECGFDGGVSCGDGSVCLNYSCQEGAGRPPVRGDIVISELMPNPSVADELGEYIEIANISNTTLDLAGVLYVDNNGDVELPSIPELVVPAGGVVVLCPNAECLQGAGAPAYVYAYASKQLKNGGEAISLKLGGVTLDELTFGSNTSWPHDDGVAMVLRPGSMDPDSNDSADAWCSASTSFGSPAQLGTPNQLGGCEALDAGSGDATAVTDATAAMDATTATDATAATDAPMVADAAAPVDATAATDAGVVVDAQPPADATPAADGSAVSDGAVVVDAAVVADAVVVDGN